MNQDSHIKVSEAVARAVGFPAAEIVGKASATPDQVHIATIDDVGEEFLGRNLSSLTHFRGYGLHLDPDLRRIDLPNRDVHYIPGAWPDLPLGIEHLEPLFQLLEVKGYTHAADEMTWPSGASYARFFELCCRRIMESKSLHVTEKIRLLATNAGRTLHYVQDYAVPQHRRNELLGNHLETENQIAKRLRDMPPHEFFALVDEETLKAAPWNAHDVCLGLAGLVTPRVSWWACRRRKVVDESIRSAIRCSASVLKHIPHEVR